MKLSSEQEKAFDVVFGKLRDGVFQYGWYYWPPRSEIKVAGYAGTGKTYLMAELRKHFADTWQGLRVAMVTFTGKASSVLEEKLRQNQAIFYGDYVGTIHGLIYRPITRYDSKLKRHIIVGWGKKDPDQMDAEIIMIDEASMVSTKMLQDLQSYRRPIIAFGDTGQLPPIGSKTTILENPHFILKQIQRQALNSPIIKLSHYVRKGGRIPVGRMYSKDVFKLTWHDPQCKELFSKFPIDKDTNILCGFNKTRASLNYMIREKFGHTTLEPGPTERVICLQNNHVTKLMNGQIGTVIWYMPEANKCFRLTLDVDGYDEAIESYVHPYCFGQDIYDFYDSGFLDSKEYKKSTVDAREKGFSGIDFMDYGYACSVHKAQGSEWNRVILFEQRTRHWDEEYYNKWLYTALTRAKQKLFIIQDFY